MNQNINYSNLDPSYLRNLIIKHYLIRSMRSIGPDRFFRRRMIFSMRFI